MDGPWEDVGSTNASYRPESADVDSYLRATVSYTDVEFDAPEDGLGRDEPVLCGRDPLPTPLRRFPPRP